MPVVEAHFFAPEDLNGPTIFECSSDDQFLKGIRLDIQRDKLGSGLVEFARRVPLGIFVNDIVQPEVFVRFLVPEISATDYLWGCFLDYRQQKVVSAKERGGEGFRFGGPGPKFYLTRTVLWSASFAGYDNAVHRDEHKWTWPESARAGAILNRLILEDQSNPTGPYLPDLTKSFSDVNDSDGVPWAEDVAAGADEFSLNIGDDYLKLLWTLENAGSLVTQMTLGSVGAPLMQLDAYQTFGRDLTGAIGASTVHFTEGVNILTDLDVEGASLRKASHALVRGADGVYELAVRPSWDPSQYRKVAFHVYENTDNNTWLDKAGVRFLQRQENGERQIKLRFQPGFDPEAGLYMPGPDGSSGHVWVGDTVDLTTGGSAQTELDYDADPQVVTGIEMELLKAVRDDSAEEAARSWKLHALLNYDRESNATVPAGGTTGGGTNTVINRPSVVLCRPGSDAVAEVTSPWEDWTWDAGAETIANPLASDDPFSNDNLNTAGSTAPPWASGYVRPGTGSNSEKVLCTPGVKYRLEMSWARFTSPDVRWRWFWYDNTGVVLRRDTLYNGSPVAGVDNSTTAERIAPDGAESMQLVKDRPSDGTGVSCYVNRVTIVTIDVEAQESEGGDGTPEMVGTSIRAARCDHKHVADDILDLSPLPAVPAIEPLGGNALVATIAFSVSNAGVRRPIYLPAGATITGILIVVTNASGNISVALYDSASSPNRLATSGAVACPAAGHRIVSFGSPYVAAAGTYWIAVSCNNTTATFQHVMPAGQAAPFAQSGTSHHPLPDPFTGTSLTRAPYMAAIVSGGLAISS